MASITDNFNRASLGSNWTVDAGGFSIISSSYVQSDTTAAVPRMRYTGTALDGADQIVSFYRQIPPGSNKQSGPTARQASSAATFYACGYSGAWSGSSGWELKKCVAGSYTTLDSESPLGWGHELTLELTVDGTSLSATAGGAHDLSATDSAISSGSYAGIAGNWADSVEGDDFAAADLVAASTGSFLITRATHQHTYLRM